MRWYRLIPTLILLAVGHDTARAQLTARHPLDGLLTREYWVVYDVLRASGRVDSATLYASVLVHEPPKTEVLAWKPGTPFRREAIAGLKQGPKTFEAIVDLAGRKLLAWKEIQGVQPNFLGPEYQAVGELIKNDSLVRAALRRRGITDLTTIECGAGPPGYFGTPEQQGRRIGRGGCTNRHGVYNTYGRPISGLVVLVDVDTKKILKVIDTGAVPMPESPVDYDQEAIGEAREPAAPIEIRQPLGPSFQLQGNEVSWQNWRFHFRVDPRVGLVVSTVHYVEGDRVRSVLYQGSLSEIFVPYMDSTTGWYDRVFLDAGEYSAEGLAEPLEPGIDCPENAVYFGDVVATSRGLPKPRARVACLFERLAGEVAWRHGSDRIGIEGRAARDLVLRMNATIGNYDYLFDWIFQQNGGIRIAVGATGVLEVRAVGSRMVAGANGDQSSNGSIRDDTYGRLVAPNILGVNHDHFFSFRLDLDIDGSNNTLVIDQLQRQLLPAEHPRRSLWVIEEKVAKVERDGQLQLSMSEPAVWRVINPSARGPLGYPVSYQIRGGHNAMSLLVPDDWPQRRAGFSNYHLWITPYNPAERYASGDYPTLSRSEFGLPTWTQANRKIENTDIVAWYTLGLHHVSRAEDWPVMPTLWHEFELRPFDFFARNPALDLPRKP